LDFGLDLVIHFLAILCWKYVTLCLIFYRNSQLRVALYLKGVEFGLLNNVGTIQTMGTHGNGLNAFSIMKWS
jgi:hypothetical protein